jgi:hypothetical protein
VDRTFCSGLCASKGTKFVKPYVQTKEDLSASYSSSDDEARGQHTSQEATSCNSY